MYCVGCNGAASQTRPRRKETDMNFADAMTQGIQIGTVFVCNWRFQHVPSNWTYISEDDQADVPMLARIDVIEDIDLNKDDAEEVVTGHLYVYQDGTTVAMLGSQRVDGCSGAALYQQPPSSVTGMRIERIIWGTRADIFQVVFEPGVLFGIYVATSEEDAIDRCIADACLPEEDLPPDALRAYPLE